MTDVELSEIEDRTARLFALYDASPHAALLRTGCVEVRRLMDHLNQHFPGNDLMRLLLEIAQMRSAWAESGNVFADWLEDHDQPKAAAMLREAFPLVEQVDVAGSAE